MAQERLTFRDRQWIEFWDGLEKGIREIGRLVGRDHSVISRELIRNGSPVIPYRAETAQEYADRRMKLKSQPKLLRNPTLCAWVVDRLQEDWSPEEIAGRSKEYPPPELHGKTVSAETVYQSIYHDEGQFLGLWRQLRRHCPVRRQRGARQSRRILIPERTSIHDRPKEVDQRTVFGHWESDTVEGRRSRSGGLSVQTERMSRFTHITLLTSKQAGETADALVRTVERVPQGAVCSVTFDNGSEGVRHTVLKTEYGIQTFFCDPYSPWQKGTVENMNGFIRQYFPKQFDPTTATREQVQLAEHRLNHRPRKVLNYRTPYEVFTQLSGALAS